MTLSLRFQQPKVQESAYNRNLVKLPLSLFDRHGQSFGQPIILEAEFIRQPLQQPQSDLSVSNMDSSILSQALCLCDLGIANFDDCVEALKKCNLNMDAACEMLLNKVA